MDTAGICILSTISNFTAYIFYIPYMKQEKKIKGLTSRNTAYAEVHFISLTNVMILK